MLEWLKHTVDGFITSSVFVVSPPPSFLSAESASCYNRSGLWQDRQERCHRQSVCGPEQHGHGAAPLVRHAGQPQETHRPVARAEARGGGGRSAHHQEIGRAPFSSCLVVLFSQYMCKYLSDKWVHPCNRALYSHLRASWFHSVIVQTSCDILLFFYSSFFYQVLCVPFWFSSFHFWALHHHDQKPPSFKQYDLYR